LAVIKKSPDYLSVMTALHARAAEKNLLRRYGVSGLAEPTNLLGNSHLRW
jgi:hypothetical protein